MAGAVTVVVSSTDGFEDCWAPFFTLFRRYWSGCQYPVVLMSETKTFSSPHQPVSMVRVARSEDTQRPTWGTCMLRAMAEIDTPYILFLLDDLFLSGPVCEQAVSQGVDLMDKHDAAMLTLTNHDRTRRYRPWRERLVSELLPRSPYRVTTSPALWRRDVLMEYLRADEQIWQFEIFGTRRSWRREDLFLRVNEWELPVGYREVIPYFATAAADTAIVKGRWQRSVVPFLREHGIEIDASVRGFYDPVGHIERRWSMARKLFNEPRMLARWWGLG